MANRKNPSYRESSDNSKARRKTKRSTLTVAHVIWTPEDDHVTVIAFGPLQADGLPQFQRVSGRTRPQLSMPLNAIYAIADTIAAMAQREADTQRLELEWQCKCGHTIDQPYENGAMYICPHCGAIKTIYEVIETVMERWTGSNTSIWRRLGKRAPWRRHSDPMQPNWR